MTKLTKEYFEDREEQARIKLAISEAIPHNVRYSNLVLALSEYLSRVVSEWASAENEERWRGEKETGE